MKYKQGRDQDLVAKWEEEGGLGIDGWMDGWMDGWDLDGDKDWGTGGTQGGKAGSHKRFFYIYHRCPGLFFFCFFFFFFFKTPRDFAYPPTYLTWVFMSCMADGFGPVFARLLPSWIE